MVRIMKIAICDYNKANVEFLVRKINNYIEQENIEATVHSFESSDELMLSFYEQYYDIVFLEADLKDNNGIDVAEIIQNINQQTIIIFMSQNFCKIQDMFRVHAFQFLKKPIDEHIFIKELKRVIKYYRSMNRSLLIETFDGQQVFNVNDIIYIETSYHQFTIHSVHGDYEGSTYFFQKIRENLQEWDFYRLQRSVFINLKHVRRFNEKIVTLSDETVLAFSKNKYEGFKNELSYFLNI